MLYLAKLPGTGLSRIKISEHQNNTFVDRGTSGHGGKYTYARFIYLQHYRAYNNIFYCAENEGSEPSQACFTVANISQLSSYERDIYLGTSTQGHTQFIGSKSRGMKVVDGLPGLHGLDIALLGHLQFTSIAVN